MLTDLIIKMENKNQQYIWNGIDLNGLREIMDPAADKAIDSIYESKSTDRLVKILQGMAENDSEISPELPKPMYDFIESELNIEFSEEDIQLFNEAREIWEDKGTKFILILLFRALPFTYMAEKPANVLRMTKLLVTQPRRRIFETAQFVFDVMADKWWERDQRGILTALKVRIMHAAMRQVVLDNDYGDVWNNDWGKPISQEDLIATNQVFSLEFFKGLEILGDPLTPQEQKAWFHTWKTIGNIMGIQENLLCKDVEEAWSLQHAIYDHLFYDGHTSGIKLAEALAETLDDFYLPRKLVIILMKKMLEDERYPDCFELLLGPTYEKEFPELFYKPETEEEKNEHKKLISKQYNSQMYEYDQILKKNKTAIFRKKQKQGIFELAKGWVLELIDNIRTRKHLVNVHRKNLHNAVKKNKTENQDENVHESITALSGVMIGILSLYFRDGKKSGFRIPKTLRANWARVKK
jgi:hypothetical protein